LQRQPLSIKKVILSQRIQIATALQALLLCMVSFIGYEAWTTSRKDKGNTDDS